MGRDALNTLKFIYIFSRKVTSVSTFEIMFHLTFAMIEFEIIKFIFFVTCIVLPVKSAASGL